MCLYQYQAVGIGIVLVVVKNHLYPISDQYQGFTGTAPIRNEEINPILDQYQSFKGNAAIINK